MRVEDLIESIMDARKSDGYLTTPDVLKIINQAQVAAVEKAMSVLKERLLQAMQEDRVITKNEAIRIKEFVGDFLELTPEAILEGK